MGDGGRERWERKRDGGGGGKDRERGTNSKHWFTTSFLQLLLYLVTP